MAQPPKTFYQPVNWGDILRKTQHLNQAEFGAYMMLRAQYWETASPLPLPKPGMMAGMMGGFSQALYRVCRCEGDSDRQAVDNVLKEFFRMDKDGYHNDELDEAISLRKSAYERNSTNGKTGVQVREAKRKAGISQASCQAYAIHSNIPKIDKESPLPPSSSTGSSKPEDSLKTGFDKGFKVLAIINDRTLDKVKVIAKQRNWDFYVLADRYDQFINGPRGMIPKDVNKAFPAWADKFAKRDAR